MNQSPNPPAPRDPSKKFIRLADRALLRRLEEPCLYDALGDELYELNDEALEGLGRCLGDMTVAQADLEAEFLEYCLEEGLLQLHDQPQPLHKGPGPNELVLLPSLRYLELQVSWRCNLKCSHCYLGKARPVDLDPAQVERVCDEFEQLGGLRLLVSGGEPLTHPRWEEINEILAARSFRKVLLTNGLLLDGKTLRGLGVDEVQISLDGMRAGHEALRGGATFGPAVKAAEVVAGSGRDLSIATMAHPGNLGELEELGELVRRLDAREWSIDVPCPSGRLEGGSAVEGVTAAQGAAAISRGFGGAYHGGSDGMACGLHLATVGADGTVAQCGFYFDKPLGKIGEGLATCWQARKPVVLKEVEGCNRCPEAEECGGGCRFRAPDPCKPDPVMCALYNVDGRHEPPS